MLCNKNQNAACGSSDAFSTRPFAWRYMYRVLYIFSLLLVSNSYASELQEFGCEALYSERESDEIKALFLPNFRALDYNSENEFIYLQSGKELEIKALRCQRSSIVPNDYDYMIVKAGYPLFIVADERLIVIEIIKGQYRVRHLEGSEFSDREKNDIGEKINFFQSNGSAEKNDI